MLGKIPSHWKNGCHYNEGGLGRKVAFLYSAPGRYERDGDKPVSGITGENLEQLLGILRQLGWTVLFPSTDRYDYRITNADDNVHFVGETGDTQAKDAVITADQNIARLLYELDGFDYVICFGNKAQVAGRKMVKNGFAGKLLPARHTGFQSLNRMKVAETGAKATRKRLTLIADALLKELQKINAG